MHGGALGSGAPLGNQNARKHGRYTAEMLAHRKYVQRVILMARQLDRQSLATGRKPTAQRDSKTGRFVREDKDGESGEA